MLTSRSRAILISIWFLSFAVNIAVVVVRWTSGDLHDDSFWAGLRGLSGAYAPYLVAVGLFYWQQSGGQKSRAKDPSGRAAIAVGSSLLWNGVVLASVLPLLFRRGDIDATIQTISVVGSTLSWLVAGAIGYYFVAPAKTQ